MDMNLANINVNDRSTNAFDLLCSLPVLATCLSSRLEARGLNCVKNAPIKVVLDAKRGFALRTLEAFRSLVPQDQEFIIVTSSLCPEYREDLWDMQPNVLVVDPAYEYDIPALLTRIAEILNCFARDKHILVAPNSRTLLNPNERLILRCIARGFSNKQIALRLDMPEKTVRNLLTQIYTNVGVRSRMEAMIYYWDLCPGIDDEHGKLWTGKAIEQEFCSWVNGTFAP